MSTVPEISRRTGRAPLFIALGMLLLILVAFVVAFASYQTPIEATTNQEDVVALLASANPENGPTLLTEYQCAACHIEGAAGGTAPSFDGLAERAASERPPLTAEAYLYESILYPSAHTVEGYMENLMPQNYRQRLTDQQLGDIIAYLLTL